MIPGSHQQFWRVWWGYLSRGRQNRQQVTTYAVPLSLAWTATCSRSWRHGQRRASLCQRHRSGHHHHRQTARSRRKTSSCWNSSEAEDSLLPQGFLLWHHQIEPAFHLFHKQIRADEIARGCALLWLLTAPRWATRVGFYSRKNAAWMPLMTIEPDSDVLYQPADSWHVVWYARQQL